MTLLTRSEPLREFSAMMQDSPDRMSMNHLFRETYSPEVRKRH